MKSARLLVLSVVLASLLGCAGSDVSSDEHYQEEREFSGDPATLFSRAVDLSSRAVSQPEPREHFLSDELAQSEEGPFGLQQPLVDDDGTEIAQSRERLGSLQQQLIFDDNGTRIWRSLETGKSSFYIDSEGSLVEESDGVVLFTFRVFSEDDHFVYAVDSSRNFEIALPVWEPGNAATSWVRVVGKSWSTWRSFEHTTLYGNACDQDSVAPVAPRRPICGYPRCRYVEITRRDYPLTMGEYMNQPILGSTLEKAALDGWGLSDNCDSDLTIRRTPGDDYVIQANTNVNVHWEVIDNHGNKLRFSVMHMFKRWNN